jgi:hypothetical protein
MPSKVEICNLGLQKLGVGAVADLPGSTPQGKACDRVFDMLRRSELRKHPWNFAIRRANLAKDAIGPEDDDWANRFRLPVDCLKVLKREISRVDSVVENGYIYSNEDIYYLRYVADVEDTGLFDPLFDMALASLIAFELCEFLTDSTVKKRVLYEEYNKIIREARKANAMENKSYSPPTDPWVNARF